MNEYEKIAAKLAEFASKLDLKGHTKIAEEVDELTNKVIASFSDLEIESRNTVSDFKPLGFEVETNSGSVTIETTSELESKLASRQTNSINIISGIKDALYKQECSEGFWAIKNATPNEQLSVAISVAMKQGIIK